MKTLIQAILLSVAFFGLTAQANDLEHTPTKIQFNERIDNTASSQQSLETEISSYFENDLDELLQEKKIDEDAGKVVEFVDAELHIGGRDETKLVDRRYDSVGPAKIAEVPKKSHLEQN